MFHLLKDYIIKNLWVFITLIYFCTISVFALEPPTKEQLKKYKKQGVLKQHIEKAKQFGNYKVKPKLKDYSHKFVIQSTNKINPTNNQKKLQGDDIRPQNTGMPTKGDIKTFTLLIAFSDAPVPPHQTEDVLYNHIYGEGLAERYPNESLTNFYNRSSYQQLHITGDVLNWYTAPYPRDDVTNEDDITTAAQNIIKEALLYHEQQGVDFSQYDNDNDGVIDYFSVIWTGEVGEWSTQWWGFQSAMSDAEFIMSGKTFGVYSWQWLSFNNEEDDFNPLVLIHETGHALGLPDYYDYDDEVGPDLEFPANDMMRNNTGDHNAFSKFLLGWIEPQVIGADSKEVVLSPSSSSQDALIIMPELTSKKGLSEYFVVQNRDQTLNDSKMSDSGLLIWHVDATPSEYNNSFLYDNSYSEHHLIKLISADDDDYYQPGHELTSITSPSSESYTPSSASVEIKNIKKGQSNIGLSASIVNVPELTLSGLQYFETIASQNLITVNTASVDPIVKVSLYANGVLVGDDTEAPYQFDFFSEGVENGSVFLKAEAFTNATKGFTQLTVIKTVDVPSLLIVNLYNDIELELSLGNFVMPYTRLNDIPIVSPDILPAMFIVGNNSNEQFPLTNEQFSRIKAYINLGGHVYYENPQWYWHRQEINQQWQQLGIEATDRWSQGDTTVLGASDSVVAGLSYSTSTPWYLFNELIGTEGFTSVKKLWNIDEEVFSNSVTNTVGSAKIIATTGLFSWLPNSSRIEVLSRYLTFFELDSSLKPPSISIDLLSFSKEYIEGETTVEFQLTRTYDDNTNPEVQVSISSPSAIAEQDYLPFESEFVSFSPNELLKTIILTLKDDFIADGDQELYVTIGGENVDEANSQIIIFVEDNEKRGKVKFSQATMVVEENVSAYEILIQRIDGSDDQIDFTIKTNGSTAISGSDYTAIDETLTFAAGEIEKTVPLTIIDNSVYATNKSFKIELISEHLINDVQTLNITINNDESAPPPVIKESSGGGAIGLLSYLLLLISCFRFQIANRVRS